MMVRWGAFFLGLLMLLGASPAAAQEVIRNFHAEATVQKDGSILVSETIRVRALGREIRRGIFRDIPTRYAGDAGSRFNVGFEFIDATRNGRPEEAKVTRKGNGVNIRLGNADTMLPSGEHTYRIRYRLGRAVGRFEEFDSLYWNVTGHGWSFPIERSSAIIRLPEDAEFLEWDSFAGRQGDKGIPAAMTRRDEREIRFEFNGTLRAGQGLTVAASFPKGVVTPLSEADKIANTLADFAPPIAGLLGFLLILGYYYHAWRTVGRDPPKGTVVPLFAPPDSLSPAAIRYLTKQQMDHRGFSAALIDSAIKGHVQLNEGDSGFFKKGKMEIIRTATRHDIRPLDEGEAAMLQALALPGFSIEMDKEHHEKFRRARKALARPYKERYEGTAFHRNLGWAFAGLLFVIAGIWIAAAAVVWAEDLAEPMQLLLSVAGVTVGALFFLGRPDEGEILRWPIIVLALIAGLGGFLIGLPFIPLAFASGNVVPVLLPMIGGGLLAISGFFWMDAPTKQGRAMLDRIAGFRQYLDTTEQERYDRMQPPREQLKLFERYLPYAIALGVENRWAKRFEGTLKAAATDPGSGYNDSFIWYSGSRNIWSNPTSFATALGANMAATIASASTAPGSSSGIGGGGFSGGGVGGGGGGGW
ncbi:DUF2207 domain-containing protein [Sphingomicrobium sediminis]|uniref:DUF2207 domain-containing protein n=1 Tax=Sphingomicrobium sediminis TaxID=2950949 RepID=UPI002446E7DA|nr:DUF2207 domain-containing protein [Sphingomicrobium sediminis]